MCERHRTPFYIVTWAFFCVGFIDGARMLSRKKSVPLRISYDGNSTSQNALDYDYEYDDLTRLTVALALPAGGIASNVYDYLKDGRIGSMQKGVKMGNYFYNEKGQLDHVQGDLVENRNLNLPNAAGYVFKYDQNGNMTKDYSKAFDGTPLEIQYQAGNMPFAFGYRLSGSEQGPSQAAKEYMAYDSRGSRAAKIDFVGGAYSRSKSYFPSGSEIREELHAAPLQFFPLAGGGRVNYDLATSLGNKEFYIQDHLGSVRESYRMGAGTLSFATHYHPYGEQFSEFNTQGSKSVTPKYTGKEKDEETRLQYFGARYFEPELAVWTSPDPESQYADLYGTSGDPVNHLDPDGATECPMPWEWREDFIMEPQCGSKRLECMGLAELQARLSIN